MEYDDKTLSICVMYEEMYGDDISSCDMVSIVNLISAVDLEHLSAHPTYARPLLEWLEE